MSYESRGFSPKTVEAIVAGGAILGFLVLVSAGMIGLGGAGRYAGGDIQKEFSSGQDSHKDFETGKVTGEIIGGVAGAIAGASLAICLFGYGNMADAPSNMGK